MGYKTVVYFGLVILSFYCSSVNSNIHRAVPGTNTYSKASKFLSGLEDENLTFDEDEEDGFLDRLYMKTNLAWLWSIPAAIIVGSTGIFPLLIFRVDSEQCLKESISPSNLKLLLSFAVGGLLGDVFLHLLPEAWMYIDHHDHVASAVIGLWIIAGMLCFLILEKIFSEEEKIKEHHEKYAEALTTDESSESTNEKDKNVENELRNRKSESVSKKNGLVNGHANGHVANGHANGHVANGHANGHIANGNIANGKANGCVANGNIKKSDLTNGHFKNGHVVDDSKTEGDDDEDFSTNHIKVVGYLNLLANCIDNFTHGLAVAGSFIVSVPVGLCTTFAILLHEIPHEIGDFAILLNAGFNRWEAAKGQLLTASGALFGCIFGLVAESAGDSSAWVLPFTSGGFLYIALFTIVPDLLQEKSARESIKQVVALLSGIGIMACASLIHH